LYCSLSNIFAHKQKKAFQIAVPISLGDSHKGYRVIGTSEEYFEHFSYGKKHSLAFKNGRAFEHILEVVIGSEIAKKLNYSVGDNIVLSHGIADTSFSKHDDMPFTIVGVLEPTGTPVDQTLHVSLESIEAIHLGWQNGVKVPGSSPKDTQLQEMDLQPKSITAFMLGLNSRLATFRIQRQINQYRKEPLSAILPGVALSELWQMMSLLESTLFFVSILVFVAAVLGLSAMLLASIRDRTNEIRLLRVIGASPLYLFFLVELETLLITVCSVLLGLGLVSVSLAMFQDMIVSVFGLHISSNVVSFNVAIFSLCMIATSMLVAAVPSLSAFRRAGKS